MKFLLLAIFPAILVARLVPGYCGAEFANHTRLCCCVEGPIVGVHCIPSSDWPSILCAQDEIDCRCSPVVPNLRR